MVCDDCTKSLSTLSAPDPWAVGGRDRAKSGDNKLLRKGVRANPYANACKICKMKVSQNYAIYCTQCAHGKGICAVCGKQVLDTSMYKMSEAGNSLHVVRDRDEAKFKSAEQIAREKAQQDLYDYLLKTGQMGRMPTRAAFEAAGQRELVTALLASFGGLHAAADAMNLSKLLLNDEAEAKKQAKREAAQREAEAAAQAAAERQAAAEQQEAAAEALPAAAGEAGSDVAPGHDDDWPPGVARPTAATTPATEAVSVPAVAPASAPLRPPPPPPASTDPRWQYDPNTGLYFQLATMAYYDHAKKQYYENGTWTGTPPLWKRRAALH